VEKFIVLRKLLLPLEGGDVIATSDEAFMGVGVHLQEY
jgi:hypothetical protein